MSMSTVIGSVELGLVFAILSLGLFIAFRILNLPDLTVDGSFVTGLAYSAVWSQVDRPYTGIIMACIGGAVAGLITGIFHTKLKIHEILAGILTMTGLYSVNLILMYLFFKTQIGLSLRATGDNEFMVRSSSINTDLMKILGFVFCNAIVALSGAVYAQYSSTATNGMGVGMLVLGLASIIIGETVVGKRGMLRHLVAVVVGAIIYRFMLTFAFAIGLPPVNLKLFSAVIVVIAISLPIIKPTYKKWRKIYAGN